MMKSSAPGVNTVSTETVRPLKQPLSALYANRFLWAGYITSLIFNDVFLTLLAFRAAYFFRFELALEFFKLEVQPAKPFYSSLSLLIMPVWLLIFIVAGLYRRENLLGGTEEY